MTFLKYNNILLFLIFAIVLINPSAAQDSPIISESSHISMRLQNISQHESSGTITYKSSPNISMEDIKLRTLIAPELPTILTPPAAKYHGPVGVFLDGVEGENMRNLGLDFFAPYILEILAHAGIPYALVSRNELVSTEITYPVLVISHTTSFSVNEMDSISRYVNGGGTLVVMGGTSGLDSILGVTVAPAHYEEGYINVTSTDGSISKTPLPLHVFSARPALPTSAVSLARFLGPDGKNTGFSAVTRNSFGMGQAWYIAPDLAFTVVKIQQGKPVVKDGVPAPDGTARINDSILRTEDGFVLNWTADRTNLSGIPFFLEPITDHLKEMFIGVIFDGYRRDGARLPLVWYWPGNQDGVVVLSHDTDGNKEYLARFMLNNITALGVNSTWCFIRYPETYSLQIFRDIANAGGETSLHYDALGYRSDTTWSEANFRSQLSWLENKTGLNVTTNKNHYGRWEGWVDFYRWSEAAGIEAEQSKAPTFSGNSGFLFGTSHPYFPIDDAQHNNRFIGVLAINLLTQDLDVKQPYYFGTALVDKALQHFGVAHFIFHPTYISRSSVALAKIVNYSLSKGMQFWTIDQINKWERTRRKIVFTNISNEGFNIESPVDVDQVTMLVLLKNDTDNLQVFINGKPITWRHWRLYGVPTARFTENIRKGVTHVDFRTIGQVYNINKSTNYTTIQAAIDDASPGDEIHVDSGTYYENVNVTKQLTLRGIGMPVVNAGGSGSAITLIANGIRLEGFTATGAGSTEAGIKIISNNNTLLGNDALNNDYGVYLYSSRNNTLIRNNASSNNQGIFLNSSNFNNITSNDISNSTSVGIKVSDNSANNIVSRNKITNSTSGMFLVYAFNTTASSNIMENNSFNFGVGGNLLSHFEGNNIDKTNLANGRPIYYVKYAKNTVYNGLTKAATFYCILCNNVTFKDLEMSNMDKGVYFWETSNSRIQNITVNQSGWGIFLRLSPNNTIQDSKLSTNNLQDYSERGVTIYSSDNNTLTNNTFILNNYGLELFSSSKNTIYNNYFNNTNNFIFTGSILKNTWNITKNPGINIIGGPYLGGNFWANPSGNGFSQTCSDSNIDGLCDLKYTLNSNNSDYLPLKNKSALGITVGSPNGGENWTRGTTKTINWTSTGSPGAYVKIELMKAGVWKSTIISSTLNDGSSPWLIPVTLTPGNDYKIKVTSTTNAAYTDTSDNTFTIPTPNITVSTPNGGETWRRGTTQTIRWNSSGSPGAYVKIELMKAGVLNRVIIASTLNDGSHPWLIPPTQAPGTDYKVRITSTANAAYNDTSDNSFTIPTPSFTVVSPNGSENWTRGTTKTIRWNSTESPGSYVKIELLKPGTTNKVIITSTLNDGSHPWLIPANQIPGNDYKIRVSSAINLSNNDTSDNYFTIPAPSFVVVSPNGLENWTRGTTQTIRWNSTESPGTYVKIELLKPGISNKVIILSTLNDGSHSWPILSTQTLGSDYRIKITSTINASVNDTSDSNFSIVPPKITVTSPNGGQTWIIGKAYPITWNYTGNPGTYVRIELLKNGLLNRIILASTPNDKSQSWIIPATQTPGTDYRIRITSTTNAAYNDTSDGNFNISATIP